MRSLLEPCIASLLVACGSGVRADPWCADSVPAPPGHRAETTYWRDARPIFDAHCVSCHTDGGNALFSLEDPDLAATWSPLIADSVTARRMPPFLAATCCQDYHRDGTLSDTEISTLRAWADQGAPVGDPADAPPPPESPAPLERIDVSIRPQAGFTPPAREDHNHCFVYDWPLDEDGFITGLSPEVDRRELVHHLIVARVGPEGIAEVERRDDEHPGPGFPCEGGLGGLSDVHTLGGSLLGGTYPRGIGSPISADSKILVQIHYWADALSPAEDRTGVDFQIAPEAEEARTLVLTNPAWAVGNGMRVKADDPDKGYGYTMRADLFTARQPVWLQGVTPHMHRYAHAMRVRVVHPDETSTCLLEIPAWDFGWEQPYWFAQPVPLAPDDALYVECRFDNSLPNQPSGQDPRTFAWGEEDQDMCAAFLNFTVTQ